MGGLDAPGFGIEVVGAGTDVLHRAKGDAAVGDGHDAAWGIGGKDESLAPQIS